MARDTMARTLVVALVLAVATSAAVSAASVGLRPMQEKNKLEERQKNILAATGRLEEGKPIADQFAAFEARVVDLQTGEFVPREEVNPDTFDMKLAASNAKTSVQIPPEEDLPRIGRRAKHALVYLLKEQGKLDQVVLPVHGNGLWSTMYGYVSLDKDGRTVKGITFYEHAETPGLGGEIANPMWTARWEGKTVTDESGKPTFKVLKGQVDPSSPEAGHQVDGLSGATLTSNGVTNLMQYWMGEQGYGPFLAKVRSGGVQ